MIGDFVALGGQAGLTGHLNIGAGAQIAAQAGVMSDVPAGERWGGAPAKPMRDWFREVAALRKLAAGAPASRGEPARDGSDRRCERPPSSGGGRARRPREA